MSNYDQFHDKYGVQPILRVKISCATSGNNTLVSAVTGYKIRVHNIVAVATSAVTMKFQSGAAGTDLTGAMPFGDNGGFAPGFDPYGHFETAASTLLNLSLGGAIQVSGYLVYSLVPTSA